MKNHEEICEVEPTLSREYIFEKYKTLHQRTSSIYHVVIQGGNENFYDKYGPKTLKQIVDSLRTILTNLKDELKIHNVGITSRFGDVYVISEETPDIKPLKVLTEEGKTLEVMLDVILEKVE